MPSDNGLCDLAPDFVGQAIGQPLDIPPATHLDIVEVLERNPQNACEIGLRVTVSETSGAQRFTRSHTLRIYAASLMCQGDFAVDGLRAAAYLCGMKTRPDRPSNGSEGELFHERFCYRCKREPDASEELDAHGCPILTASFIYDVGDEDYPAEWIEDDAPYPHTNPRCTAFEPR